MNTDRGKKLRIDMFILYAAMTDPSENLSKFQLIYEKHKQVMYTVAYDISKNSHTAEDIVQVSMMKVIGILNKIDANDIDKQRCKNLMITIAKHTAIDYLRKESSELPSEILEFSFSKDGKSAEEVYFDTTDYSALIDCMNSLDEKYRDVLRLRALHNLSSKETAKILNISIHNVNMRYMRAKQLLAEQLKEHKNV